MEEAIERKLTEISLLERRLEKKKAQLAELLHVKEIAAAATVPTAAAATVPAAAALQPLPPPQAERVMPPLSEDWTDDNEGPFTLKGKPSKKEYIREGSIECNVQCYINSVGECYKEDQLFTFDTETIKVVSRSYCNNYTETLSAIETCYFDDQSCFSSFTSAFTADILTLYIAGNYSEYRQQYCSLLSTLQSCLSGSTVSGCSLQQANLLKDIYLVSSSYSKCGEQNHAYFTTYGYDVTCGSKACLSNSFWFFVIVFVTVRKFIV